MENKKAEDIIIAASTQQTVIDELEDFARQRGKHLVLLNDKVITDYIKGTEQAEKQPSATVESFLQNEKNREEAEIKAIGQNSRGIKINCYVTKNGPGSQYYGGNYINI